MKPTHPLNALSKAINFTGGPWDGSSLPCSPTAFELLLHTSTLYLPPPIPNYPLSSPTPSPTSISTQKPKNKPSAAYALTSFSPDQAFFHWIPNPDLE